MSERCLRCLATSEYDGCGNRRGTSDFGGATRLLHVVNRFSKFNLTEYGLYKLIIVHEQATERSLYIGLKPSGPRKICKRTVVWKGPNGRMEVK